MWNCYLNNTNNFANKQEKERKSKRREKWEMDMNRQLTDGEMETATKYMKGMHIH